MDIQGVTVLVHFNVPDDLPTLIQRFGRAARDPNLAAICILLVPPGYFYADREAQEERAEKARAKKCRKTRESAGSIAAPIAAPAVEDMLGTSAETQQSKSIEGENIDEVRSTSPKSPTPNGPTHPHNKEYIPAPTPTRATNAKRKRTVTRERFATTESLDAWINADRLPTNDYCHGCHRKAEHRFFGLDQIRAWNYN